MTQPGWDDFRNQQMKPMLEVNRQEAKTAGRKPKPRPQKK